MLVDSHVNLHGERFADDLPEIMARAYAAGIGTMLAISDRLDHTDEIRQVVATYPNVWRSVGVHPHHAKDYTDLTAGLLIDHARDERVVGIGECGLDFFYEYSERALQEPVFRAHIAAARETGLPLIIHSRDADEEMIRILKEEFAVGPFVPLLHCYTGGPALAELALSLGGYVAFSGIITFKTAAAVRAVAASMPLNRMIIETDCPFLAPMPHRGRRNEPSYLPHVADKLAEIMGVSRAEIDQSTTDAFFELFSRAVRPS